MGYEVFEKLCKIKDVTPYRVAQETTVSTSTLSSWKVGRYIPKNDKIKLLADYFNVTPGFLLGTEKDVICPVCHQHYDPVNESQSAEHSKYHERFVKAREKYGEMPSYGEADKARDTAIDRFRNKRLPDSERIEAFEDYLRNEFTREVYRSGFDLSLDFDDFAYKEIDGLRPDTDVSIVLINQVREGHGMPQIEDKSGGGYYLNDETARIAQDIFENKELRLLFSVQRDMEPEDLKALHNMALALKRKEGYDGDDPA